MACRMRCWLGTWRAPGSSSTSSWPGAHTARARAAAARPGPHTSLSAATKNTGAASLRSCASVGGAGRVGYRRRCLECLQGDGGQLWWQPRVAAQRWHAQGAHGLQAPHRLWAGGRTAAATLSAACGPTSAPDAQPDLLHQRIARSRLVKDARQHEPLRAGAGQQAVQRKAQQQPSRDGCSTAALQAAWYNERCSPDGAWSHCCKV